MATATPATSHSDGAATPPDDGSDLRSGPAAGAGRAAGAVDAHRLIPALRSVNGAARIDRLRSLIARLERSPQSHQRDAVLSAARQRVVTVDTGSHDPSAWRSERNGERVATVDTSSHDPSHRRSTLDDGRDSLALLVN